MRICYVAAAPDTYTRTTRGVCDAICGGASTRGKEGVAGGGYLQLDQPLVGQHSVPVRFIQLDDLRLGTWVRLYQVHAKATQHCRH